MTYFLTTNMKNYGNYLVLLSSPKVEQVTNNSESLDFNYLQDLQLGIPIFLLTFCL